MAEPTPTPEAAPAADPVADIPDTSSDQGEFSFEQALEASILNAENPPAEAEPEAQAEAAPEVQEAQADEPKAVEESAQAEESGEADESGEAKESSEETSDLLESLDADVGDDWTPKASAAFQKLKATNKGLLEEREQLTQRAREAEAKITELEGAVGNETVETLQQRLQEYENAQMLNNLESTDAYREAVLNPLEQIFVEVEKMADNHDVAYQDLVDAIAIEDPTEQEAKVAELLVTATDREKATFYRLAAEIDPILQRRDMLHENAAEALKEAELVAEQRMKSEAAERAAKRVEVTKNVAQRIQDKVPFLTGFDGLDMNAISAEASDVDPSVVHPVDFAYQAVAARIMPSMVKEFAAAQKQIEQLTAQLATYEDAEPKLSGGSNTSAATSSSSESTDFGSAIERALGGI